MVEVVKAHAKALVHGKAHGVVISAVTAQVARGFTFLPGLLGKIGTRLRLGRPGYLYSKYPL